MNRLLTNLSAEIKQLFPKIVEIRRHLHRYPELSFEEYKTSAYVQKQLAILDISYEVVADTGVVALIEGERTGADDIVVLRADMDALPIHEQNEVDYKSVNEGVMHACGHDFHTANLL